MFVGKLIPPEQFVSRRAAEFLAHPADTQALALVLPALEHSYFFHGMQQMGRSELARALAEVFVLLLECYSL